MRKDYYKTGALGKINQDYYDYSTMDVWFNEEYITYLSDVLVSAISTTTFDCAIYQYSTFTRPIFTLSNREMEHQGLDNNDNEGTRLPISGTLTNISYQWTRSQYTSVNYSFWMMYNHTWQHYRADQGSGYRPCFTLPNTTTITEGLYLIEKSINNQ